MKRRARGALESERHATMVRPMLILTPTLTPITIPRAPPHTISMFPPSTATLHTCRTETSAHTGATLCVRQKPQCMGVIGPFNNRQYFACQRVYTGMQWPQCMGVIDNRQYFACQRVYTGMQWPQCMGVIDNRQYFLSFSGVKSRATHRTVNRTPNSPRVSITLLAKEYTY
jgi:hypothetical protein